MIRFPYPQITLPLALLTAALPAAPQAKAPATKAPATTAPAAPAPSPGSVAKKMVQGAHKMEITLERLDLGAWHAIDPNLVLADGDEATGFEPAPFMVIGIIGATPPNPDDRARFAQESATRIPGVRDWKITMSEPIRIDGQPAYETRLDATSGKDNTQVTVVQWLRFGGPRMLRIVGSAPRDKWSEAFPRFRAVRDGIKPRG